MYVPLRTQLIQQVPWFFEPCFEHLGFLSRDCGLTWGGYQHIGPEAYAEITFDDDRLHINVCSWFPMGLPELTVVSVRRERRVLDLSTVIPTVALENEAGNYHERYKRAYPAEKEAEVVREFEAATAERIARFGTFLHDHLHTLRRAA